MDPQRKKIVFWGAVIVGIALFGYYQYKRALPPVAPTATTTAGPAPSSALTPAAPVDADKATAELVKIDTQALAALIEKGNFIYDYSDLRDPMTPVMYGGAERAGRVADEPIAVSRVHTLEAVVWRADNPLASIDGVVVGIGERLADGAVVKEILRDKVILSTPTGMFSVGFYEE